MWRYFAGAMAILATVAGVTYVVVDLTNLNEPDTEDVGTVTGDGSAVDEDGALPAGDARITGVVTAVFLTGAELDPLPMPLVVNVLQDNEDSGATIQGVTVDDTASTIEWDGGTPLQLDGDGGSLDLTGAGIAIVNNELSIVVDGLQGFTPGTYQIDASVAVGTTGAARARDSVEFVATEASSAVFRGAATITRALDEFATKGRGALSLTGEFEVESAFGTLIVTELQVANGNYDIRVRPDDAGLLVDATVQGGDVSVLKPKEE